MSPPTLASFWLPLSQVTSFFEAAEDRALLTFSGLFHFRFQNVYRTVFKSCEFAPIPLRKDQEEMETIFLLPPDPLHVNLFGPVNDVLEKMEEIWPCET